MNNWIESQLIISMLMDDIKNKKGYYKATQYDKQEEYKIYNEVLQDFKEARIYEIRDNLARLFTLTPNEARVIRLPFDKLYLDINILYNKITIHGIMITGQIRKMGKDETGEDLFRYGLLLTFVTHRKKDGVIVFGNTWLREPNIEIDKETNKHFKGNVCNLIRRTVMNFNDFLEHPDIIITERTRKNQKKRKKRGKAPLPDSTVIKVRGELKIYLDSIRPKKNESNDVGLCYEVAGHWRRFRSPRYVHMQGKKIFIHPFIKGTGKPTIKRRAIEKKNEKAK